MLSKSEIQLYSKLKQKKYRNIENLFVAEGKRLVEEGINSQFKPHLVAVTEEFNERESEFISLIKTKKIRWELINNIDLKNICSTKNPQGIFAVFKKPEKNEQAFNDEIIVGLENISDPGNLGTILRSCVWFGIKTVVMNKECADIYNPKVLRSGMGAVFKLNIYENIDLIKLINELKNKNYRSVYADMEGEDYRSLDLGNKTILTFCNEASGPSEELADASDLSITIPSKGDIDSLNVGAAAAVILSVIN